MCSRNDGGSDELISLVGEPRRTVAHEPLRHSAEPAYARRMQTDELVTAEQLVAMGRAGYAFELVDGRMVSMNPPNHPHGEVAVTIATAMKIFVRANGLGRVVAESGYILKSDPDTVRGPDVSFVRAGRAGYPPPHGFFRGAPDLAVEVRSPDDSMAGLLAKGAEYLSAGAQLVWIVDPEDRTVRVLRRGDELRMLFEGDALDGGAVLPEFTMPIAEIFA